MLDLSCAVVHPPPSAWHALPLSPFLSSPTCSSRLTSRSPSLYRGPGPPTLRQCGLPPCQISVVRHCLLSPSHRRFCLPDLAASIFGSEPGAWALLSRADPGLRGREFPLPTLPTYDPRRVLSPLFASVSSSVTLSGSEGHCHFLSMPLHCRAGVGGGEHALYHLHTGHI